MSGGGTAAETKDLQQEGVQQEGVQHDTHWPSLPLPCGEARPRAEASPPCALPSFLPLPLFPLMDEIKRTESRINTHMCVGHDQSGAYSLGQ